MLVISSRRRSGHFEGALQTSLDQCKAEPRDEFERPNRLETWRC